MKKTVLAFLSVALFFTSLFTSAATIITDDDRCLDVAWEIKVGSSNAGREVIASSQCDQGKNQQWQIENGLIKTSWNGEIWCLDVNMSSAPVGDTKTGLDVIVWPNCHGGKNQKWEVKDGFIRSQENDWCLDRDINGDNVIVWHNCHGGKNQKWAIEASATTVPLITVDGWCLDVAKEIQVGGSNAGRKLIAWPECHQGKNQQWQIENGLIMSNWDGKTWCLDVNMSAPVGSGQAGLNVIVWPNCHGGSNQKWEIKDGFIRSQVNGWCLDRGLDLNIGGDKKGRNVIVWPDCHGGQNQKWSIVASSIEDIAKQVEYVFEMGEKQFSNYFSPHQVTIWNGTEYSRLYPNGSGLLFKSPGLWLKRTLRYKINNSTWENTNMTISEWYKSLGGK